MAKKITIVIMAYLMLFSLASCAKKSDDKIKVDGSVSTEQVAEDGNTGDSNDMQEGFVFRNDSSSVVDLGTPDTHLDPQEVYKKLTYTPQMFYGDYRLLGGNEASSKFGTEAEYHTWTQNGKEIEISKLPFRIEAGSDSMNHSINYIDDYEWMRLSFMQRHGGNSSMTSVYCAYTVEEGKLILKPLDTFNVDTKNNKITFAFSDVTWEYTFAFNGRNITLTAGDSSVTLTTGLDPYGKMDYFSVDGYLSQGSKRMENVDQITLRYDADTPNSSFYIELADKTMSYNSVALLQDNGIFTFTLALKDSVKTYQYVYFYGGKDGLILTDGNEVYYYNDSYSERSKSDLREYLTEDQTGKLDDMSESELKAVVEKKENLMEDLAKAFNDAGIKVTVDEKSGELAMDSSVLFGGDSDVLTSEGKTFLNKFVNAYTSIVFSEKYEGFVSKTMIEGHTAPLATSTYESGLPLSQQRANNVKNYCVSSETGVDTTKLAANLEAVGYSNSKPVKDANGNVDLAASRRVSFRFIINLQQK